MLNSKLNDIMKREGRKQAWLHRETRISTNTISRIVNGKVAPSLEHAIKIAKALGRTVNDIWDWEDE